MQHLQLSRRSAGWCGTLVSTILFSHAVLAGLVFADDAASERFGGATRGGEDGTVVEVTSLDDGGRGTLRAALQAGGRRIVFKVAGNISLKQPLVLAHPDVTIDGATAPRPGVSITGKPFVIADTHDVVVRHVRFRDSDDDNLRITGECRDIVIDHCSSTRAGDGAIDVALDYKTQKRPRDVTISWCLIGGTEKAMLLAGASRLSLHHNLFTNNGQRHPQLQDVEEFDFRHNVVRNWSVYGLRVRGGSTGNIVGNVFGPSSKRSKDASLSLIVSAESDDEAARPTDVFVRHNVGPDGFDPNRLSTTETRFPAPPIEDHQTRDVEAAVLNGAGAQPPDAIDRELLRGAPELLPRQPTTK